MGEEFWLSRRLKWRGWDVSVCLDLYDHHNTNNNVKLI